MPQLPAIGLALSRTIKWAGWGDTSFLSIGDTNTNSLINISHHGIQYDYHNLCVQLEWALMYEILHVGSLKVL